MGAESLLMQALVYLAASVVAVPVASRLGLGSVLGYLIAGAAIGPFALHLVGEQTDVMHFAEFGVVILLFLIGLEVRPALLWRLRGSIFGLGGLQLLATTAVVGAAAFGFGLDWRIAVAVGLILSMSSTAIALQTLEEKGLRRGAVGGAAFGVLLFQDLSVIPLFALLPLLAAAPAGGAAAAHAGAEAALLDGAPAWVRALAVLAAVGAVVAGGRYLIAPGFRYIAAARLREMFTATALLLVVAVAALMQLVGLSPALGAFLAGVMLAESEFRRELEADIEPFRGLLLGLFFITVGASLDLGLVASRPLPVIGAALGLMLAKAVVLAVLARLFRLPNRDAGTAAVALCQGGEFAFVLVGFCVAAGVLPAALGGGLNAVVAVSMLFSPLAFLAWERLAAPRRQRRRERPAGEEAFEPNPDVIIAGYGRFGQIAGRLIDANGFRTSVLDVSVSHIERLRRFGRRVQYGDASRLDLLRAAGIEGAKLLIVAIDDREKAVELVELARTTFPRLKILARAWDRGHAYELLARGADKVERETYEGSLVLGREALQLLGQRAPQAWRAAALFRRHDHRLFDRLRPLWGDEAGFVLASRQSAAMLEQLLREELSTTPNDPEGWHAADRPVEVESEV